MNHPSIVIKRTPDHPPYTPQQSPISIRHTVVLVYYQLPLDIEKGPDGQWKLQWLSERSHIAAMRHLADGPPYNNFDKHTVWFVGWPGVYLPKSEQSELEEVLKEYHCIPVFLTKDEKEKFYDKFCRKCLFNIFHYALPTTASLQEEFSKTWELYWGSYVSANRKYAQATISLMEEQNLLVWVHNYQLLMVPKFLRQRVNRIKLGVFMHAPFPTSDIFRCIPNRSLLLQGMLSADLIGFHTFDYARHFMSCCRKILDLEIEVPPGGRHPQILYCGRFVQISIRHIGVLSHAYEEKAKSEQVTKTAHEWIKKYNNRKIIVGYVETSVLKGGILAIEAYARLLHEHPDLIDKVILVLLVDVIGQKEERLLFQQKMESEVSRIRRNYGDEVIDVLEPQPRGKQPLSDIAPLYKASTSALICNFWDGLNLVPYEYTLAQGPGSQTEFPIGSLVISEFMGCARSLTGVIRVNPWNISEVSDAIFNALTMEHQQRLSKHVKRYEYVLSHNIMAWAHCLIEDIEAAYALTEGFNYMNIGLGLNAHLVALRHGFGLLQQKSVEQAYNNSQHRLFLINLDSIISESESKQSKQILNSLILHLKNISEKSQNQIYILSSQKKSTLVKQFKNCPHFGLVAEKGNFICWADTTEWKSQFEGGEEFLNSWKHIVVRIMKNYYSSTDGAIFEEQESTVLWNWEESDNEYGKLSASDLQKTLFDALDNKVDITRFGRTIQVSPHGVDKYFISKLICDRFHSNIKENSNVFIFYLGEDRFDEDIFEELNKRGNVCSRSDRNTSDSEENISKKAKKRNTSLANAFSVVVGIRPTYAKYYVNEISDIADIFSKLN